MARQVVLVDIRLIGLQMDTQMNNSKSLQFCNDFMYTIYMNQLNQLL